MSAPSDPLALGQRLQQPHIVETIVSYLHTESNPASKAELYRLLRVSKTFFHAVAPALYRTLACEFQVGKNPFVDAGMKDDLLGYTETMLLTSHSTEDCEAITASLNPKLPRVRSLVIHYYPHVVCTGLECPLIENARPNTLRIEHLAAANGMPGYIPELLLANVTTFEVSIGNVDLRYVGDALTIPWPPSASRIELRFMIFPSEVLQYEEQALSIIEFMDQLAYAIESHPIVPEVRFVVEGHEEDAHEEWGQAMALLQRTWDETCVGLGGEIQHCLKILDATSM